MFTPIGIRFACSSGLLAGLLLGCAYAPRYDGELGMGFDSNVANAAEERRTRSSAVFLAGGAAEQRYPLGERTALFTRGGIRLESVSRYDGLSQIKLSGLLRLQHRPRAEFLAPAYSLWSSASYAEFDSELRDAAELRVGASAEKALSTTLSLRLALSATEREAEASVFEGSSQSASLQADWQLDHDWLIYAGYQFRRGDVVSTNPPDPVLLRINEARAPDDVFAGEIAYRFDADTQVASLGCNRSLSHSLALDAQLQYISSEAGRGGVDYSRWLGLISLLRRF